MKNIALRHGFRIVIGILILPTFVFSQKNLSHVRVVRLSYISGTVGVKRPAATEWAKAQVNTPIQEGFELLTSANSYAEVEFENGSTMRLGEISQASFDQLAMDEDGNKLNRFTFEKGYATFHFLPEHHDVYGVKLANTTLTPMGKSEFRADYDGAQARVEVFAGSVEVATPAKTVKLGKDKILKFNPEGAELAANQQQGIVKDSWDKWTSQRDVQEQLSLSDSAVASPGSLYGWSDLNTYGEWGFFPGFGYGWSPFAAAGWSPFTMGMWSWYPGMGYTWIGGEAWGWLPYHFGAWEYSAEFGWFWMPGNFSSFSPAMVNWYSGPGWIGWAPLGVTGARALPIMTTVPGGAVQAGTMISPQSVTQVPLSAGTRIKQLPFEPAAGAMLSGAPISAAELTASAAAGTAPHAMAPASVLMGGDGAREQSLSASGRQPLRVRAGATLGGRFAVGGAVGEFRGNAESGESIQAGHIMGSNASAGGNGPVLLPHGQQVSLSHPPNQSGGMPGEPASLGMGNSADSAAKSPSSTSGARTANASGEHH